MSRILLVEDDPLCSRFVEDVLRRAGHSVVTRTTAADALDFLTSTQFEMVISDVNIPGGASGFDLVRTIRKSSKNSDLPICFFTGRGEPNDVKRALACGVDDYMVKPVDPEILVSKISTLLEKAATLGRDFAHKEVQQSARLELEIVLKGLSEAGVTFTLPFPVAVEAKLRINCDLFEELGVGVTNLRVLGCHPSETIPVVYLIDANFIGLSEAKLQLIRRWIICNPDHNHARATV
jgi:CheY-like chemotaxis protein